MFFLVFLVSINSLLLKEGYYNCKFEYCERFWNQNTKKGCFLSSLIISDADIEIQTYPVNKIINPIDEFNVVWSEKIRTDVWIKLTIRGYTRLSNCKRYEEDSEVKMEILGDVINIGRIDKTEAKHDSVYMNIEGQNIVTEGDITNIGSVGNIDIDKLKTTGEVWIDEKPQIEVNLESKANSIYMAESDVTFQLIDIQIDGLASMYEKKISVPNKNSYINLSTKNGICTFVCCGNEIEFDTHMECVSARCNLKNETTCIIEY